MLKLSKHDAQQRVDRISAFRAELAEVLAARVISLDSSQLKPMTDYHEAMIKNLVGLYDVDISAKEKQLSLGMKIISFLGALALAASIFFLFYQFWGQIPLSGQIAILVAAPVLATLLASYISFREKTGYFSKLAGLVAFSCFVLNLSMLGTIFNITPSHNAFLVWAAFATLLAYAMDARLLLVFAILSFAAFLSAQMGTWGGCYWLSFGERPENFFPAAIVLWLISLVPHQRYSGFSSTYRIFAMLLIFLPVLVLANYGRASYLELPRQAIQHGYQICGFVFSAISIFIGIRKNLAEVINTGTVFFTIFLYTKFYDWWWHIFPKYLFFMLIALTAILMLLVLKRLREQISLVEREVGK